MEMNVQELLKEYSEQEGKNEAAIYDDEIRAEFDCVDAADCWFCCIQPCCC